jgi:hypothetical protein
MIDVHGSGNYEIVPFPEGRKRIDIGDYYGELQSALMGSKMLEYYYQIKGITSKNGNHPWTLATLAEVFARHGFAFEKEFDGHWCRFWYRCVDIISAGLRRGRGR